MGRSTRYCRAYDDTVYKLCLLNAIDEQIAGVFNVSTRTIDNWKKKHKTFLRAIKKGKIQADAEVAKSLFHRATGYEHKDTKVFCTDGKITTYTVIKHYPPEVAAIAFWLKNRQGWTDKAEVVVTDERITTQERTQMREILQKRRTIKLRKGA